MVDYNINHIGKKSIQFPALCEKGNKQKKFELTEHIQNMNVEFIPYPCYICQKTFTQKGSLTRHIQIIHIK